jgi:predicted nucleotidyltransferase
MVTLESLRSAKREQVLRLAALHGARNVGVFGSLRPSGVARGESSERSDVDLPVDWEPGRSRPDQFALVQDLEETLGARIHLGTEQSLHWYVRDRILREAPPL